MKIILASASPRRLEIMNKHGISPVVMPQDTDETLPEGIGMTEAVEMLQEELIQVRNTSGYLNVLAGLALEGAARLPAGSEVKIQLAREDGGLGEPLAVRLKDFRPDLTFSFDTEAAPILGGVWLSAPDGSWRVPADWREVINGMKDSLAGRVLSIL